MFKYCLKNKQISIYDIILKGWIQLNYVLL